MKTERRKQPRQLQVAAPADSLTFDELLAAYRASPPEARARFLARLDKVEEK
jgi:hypothetical protein